jgi:hypothetical protein
MIKSQDVAKLVERYAVEIYRVRLERARIGRPGDSRVK